jgi:hypothetical protein
LGGPQNEAIFLLERKTQPLKIRCNNANRKLNNTNALDSSSSIHIRAQMATYCFHEATNGDTYSYSLSDDSDIYSMQVNRMEFEINDTNALYSILYPTLGHKCYGLAKGGSYLYSLSAAMISSHSQSIYHPGNRIRPKHSASVSNVYAAYLCINHYVL